jgi:flavin-dependent dehydrogenase
VSHPEKWSELFRTTALFRKLESNVAPALVRAAPAGISVLPRRHGPRWIAAGDAAAKLDPLGSSGTCTAIASGRRAGLAVSEALRGNREPIEHYARWSDGLLKAFLVQREQHYRIEARRRESAGFWIRRLRSGSIGADPGDRVPVVG